MDEKVILVVRKPDIEKTYPCIELIGQIQILSLAESEDSADAAGIM
jgi:hypothetical protein